MAWAASPTMTTESATWCGSHLMLMSGRWGLLSNEVIRVEGSMREETPGKWASKKAGTELRSDSRAAKCPEGRKRVHVKQPS